MKLGRRPDTGRQIIALLRYTLFMIGIGLYLAGLHLTVYNVIYAGITVFFVSNLFFGFAEGKTRYIFLFFHLSFFTFLLSRPLILYLQGTDRWIWYGRANTQIALNIIMIALVALRFGALIGDGIEKRLAANAKRAGYSRDLNTPYQEEFRKNLMIVSLIFFAVAIAASFAEGAQQLLYMRGRTYNEFFLNYKSSFPYPVIALASMAKYALCIFLAAFPKKKAAVTVLVIYLLDAVPSLIIGIRNPLILRAIFSLIYFIMRDAAGSKEKWVGRKEKAFMIIGTPVAIAALGVLAALRVGSKTKGGFFYYLAKFFYNQGVSFDTVRSIVKFLPQLPHEVPKNYTFGPFIDYIKYGSLGQKLFGTPDIGNTNSAIKAIYGNNLSHSSYYVINRTEYLKGWGKGSSYVVENYADAGYAGVIVFGLVLGAVLVLLTCMLKYNNTLVRTITMVALLGLFFIPRAEATGWITFLIYFQFWALVTAVYLIAGLCVKKYSYKNISEHAVPTFTYQER